MGSTPLGLGLSLGSAIGHMCGLEATSHVTDVETKNRRQ